jgi:uncharacterized protein
VRFVSAARLRQRARDIWEERRLVATIRSLHSPRQQVRRVRLDQHAIVGNARRELVERPAAALVADPARDADVAIEREVVLERGLRVGEAMHADFAELRAMRAQDRDEVRVRVALVQEQRLAQLDRERELRLERRALGVVRRVIAEVVEAAFAKGDKRGIGSKLADRIGESGVPVGREMRVKPGGGVEAAAMPLRQRERLARAFRRAAGDDNRRKPCIPCALENGVAIAIEAVVREVGADVDERGRRCGHAARCYLMEMSSSTDALPAAGQASPLLIPGAAGNIEALLAAPKTQAARPGFAVICHPHPLYGGAFSNKVVYSLAACALKAGLYAMRFNFRGVGRSEGAHDEGRGETEDTLAVIDWMRARLPSADLLLAGFSFGAFVSLRASTRARPRLQVSVAPPYGKYLAGVPRPARPPCPWLVVHGRDDDVVSYADTTQELSHYDPAPELVSFDSAGHFFHGRLGDLQHAVSDFIERHWAAGS